MRNELGDSAVDAFVNLKMQDWMKYVEASDNPLSTDITRWELERYLHAN